MKAWAIDDTVLADPPTQPAAAAAAERELAEMMNRAEEDTRLRNPKWRLIASWPHMRLWETDEGTYAAQIPGKRWAVKVSE